MVYGVTKGSLSYLSLSYPDCLAVAVLSPFSEWMGNQHWLKHGAAKRGAKHASFYGFFFFWVGGVINHLAWLQSAWCKDLTALELSKKLLDSLFLFIHFVNSALFFMCFSGKEESVATFKGNEFFCYDLSLTPIQSSTDEITLSFRTLQRNGLMLHTGKSADYVNLSLKSGAVWLVINLGSGAFEALVEPVNGKFNDNAWHDVRVTRNLRQVSTPGAVHG